MSYLNNSNTTANPNYIPPATKQFCRATALDVLKNLSKHMYPSYDLYGNKTLVIDRDKFEAVRAKYLDRKE